MGITAALFVPRGGAFANQDDPFIHIPATQRARQIHRLLTREIVPPARPGVHSTIRAEKKGIRNLVPHDAAGNRSDTVIA